MTHGHHDLPRRIFGDDCEECRQRASTIAGLAELDSANIVKLGDLAAEMDRARSSTTPLGRLVSNLSITDQKAVENLRLAARLVFASGITEKVAE